MDYQHQRAAGPGPPAQHRPGRNHTAQLSADWGHEDLESSLREPPAPLDGYQVAEITIAANSPAAGQRLADVTWPAGCTPVSVLRGGRLRPAGPATVLRPGDRVSLLVPAPGRPGRTSGTVAPAAGGAAPALSGSAPAAGPGPAPGEAGDPATAGRAVPEHGKTRGVANGGETGDHVPRNEPGGQE